MKTEKHAGGAPSKLTPEARKLAIEYLDKCARTNTVPVAARLAFNIGVSKKTLYNWAESDQEFLHTLDRINNLQEAILVDGALANELNATIAKLMLSNHGYVEKKATDLTTNGKDLPSPILGGATNNEEAEE